MELNLYTYKSLYKAIDTENDAIRFCMENGLLLRNRTCTCGREMRLKTRTSGKTLGHFFRCDRYKCEKEVSLRRGTFFSGSKLSIAKIVEVLYFVVRDNQAQDEMQFQLEVGGCATIVDWKNFVRDIMSEYFIRNPIKIGGPGIIVEIDECMLVKRKYNRGRLVREQWIFGGYETESKRSFFIPVERRDRVTLHNCILEYVEIGSIIMSDEWAAYGDLEQYGYEHYTVNHSLNFVDPITGATTNHVESGWQKLKISHVKRYGTARSMLSSYLFEWLWRQRFGREFGTLIQHITEVYYVDPE